MSEPTKLDLRKQYRELYRESTEPRLIDVPPLPLLMIDGVGDPNGEAFQGAMQALYSIAYGIKFDNKKSGKPDFTVMAAEAQWHGTDEDYLDADRNAWRWTLLMVVPDFITGEQVSAMAEKVANTKGVTAARSARLDVLDEGQCAQIMHLGPYATERPTIERLHAFIVDQGLHLTGSHHEIYLNDPRRTAPERIKTLIRQPVAR